MTILNQSRATLLKLAGEVVLTPAGRDRLDWSVGPIDDENDKLWPAHRNHVRIYGTPQPEQWAIR